MWIASAINSFPVPDSPLIRTLISDLEIFPIALKTFCNESALPIIFDPLSKTSLFLFICDLESLSAFCAKFLIESTSNGFGKYSKAPPLYADRALSISEWAVITIVGSPGC